MDLSQLVESSNKIFVGKVKKVSCRWNENHSLIVTDVLFSIEESLKGKYGEDFVKYTFSGGQLDGESHQLSVVPSFYVGEKLLIMIDQKSRMQFSPVTGGTQGKFSSQHFSNSSGRFKSTGKGDSSMTFNDFVSVVKNNLSFNGSGRHKMSASLPVNLSYSELANISGHESCGCSSKSSVSRQAFKTFAQLSSVPVSINPRPATDSLIAGKDIKMMEEWNKYANVFAAQSSTGSWNWLDGVFDIAGFVDEATMQSTFGTGWGNSLGVTFTKTNSRNEIVEADIFLNPSARWAPTNKIIPFMPYAYGVELTLIHELGHVLGLDHDFTELSVMNYAPQKYDGEYMLRSNDIKAIMSLYPSAVKDNKDVGIYLYKSSGYRYYASSKVEINGNVASEAKPGETVRIVDYTIENVGVQSVGSVQVHWYLSPDYGVESSSVLVGSSQTSALASGLSKQFTSSFTVPEYVPPGEYYISAKIDDVSDSNSTNNRNWLQKSITVINSNYSPDEKSTSNVETNIYTESIGSGGGGGGGGCLIH